MYMHHAAIHAPAASRLKPAVPQTCAEVATQIGSQTEAQLHYSIMIMNDDKLRASDASPVRDVYSTSEAIDCT